MKRGRMPELLEFRRHSPTGAIAEGVLLRQDHGFVLKTPESERRIDAADVPSALKSAPEITTFAASDRLSVTCADAKSRASLIAMLVDSEPDVEFDDSRWPEDAATPPWDEYPDSESVLRRRWIEIDGAEYHPLDLPDRTRAVRYDSASGLIDAGEVLVRARWTVDSAVTSSEGDDTLALVGGDVLLSQQRGELPGASIEVISAGALPERIANWLADNAYAPSAVLSIVGTPGLPVELKVPQAVQIDGYLAPAVLDALCRSGDTYARLRRALAELNSEDGESLYVRLSAVASGDELLQDVLAPFV
jgi:hypothetical protein